ncbi:DUF2514 family protein [Cupriavidus gilardii]|nr:DUF2514 family protein [Cupriavidus gilardii]
MRTSGVSQYWKQEADQARADARAADSVAGQLRQRVADLVAATRAGGDLSPTSGGQAAGYPLDVLTVMFSGLISERENLLNMPPDPASLGERASGRTIP